MNRANRGGLPLAGLTIGAILLASTAGYVSAISRMFQAPLTPQVAMSSFHYEATDEDRAAEMTAQTVDQTLVRTAPSWLLNALPGYSSSQARMAWYSLLDRSGDRRVSFEISGGSNGTRSSNAFLLFDTTQVSALAPATGAFAYSSTLTTSAPSVPNAPLADQTWDGGTTGNGTAWYTLTNWVGDAGFPGSGSVTTNTDIANIGSTGTNPSIGINGATNATLYLGAINFTGGTRLIGDSSNTSFTLQLNGATVNSVANVILRNSGTGTLTLAPTQANAGLMSIALGNTTDNIINIDNTGGITISAVIKNGTGSKLTFNGNGNGAGFLTLSGLAANTYTGLTTVNVGEMDLAKTAGLNAIPGNLTIGDNVGLSNTATVKLLAADQIANTSDVTINSDGVLNLNNNNETIDALNSSSASALVALGGGTLTVGASNENIFTYAGSITGTGGLTKAGAGILVLSGSNTYTGDTTIKAGELFLTASGTLAPVSTIRLGDTIASNPPAMFTFGSTTGGVTISNQLIVQTSGGADGTRTLLGLAENGATNTWAGNIILNSNLTVQSAAAGGSVTNGQGILLFQGGSIDVGTSTLTMNSNLRGNNADTYSIQGIVVINELLGTTQATGGSLFKDGSGTLILQGTNNNYTGTNAAVLNPNGTRIGGGVLGIYGDGSLGLAPVNAANNVFFTTPGTNTNTDSIAPTLRAETGGITLAATRNLNIAPGVTGTFDSNGFTGANAFTVSGVINGGGNLNKTGAGTVVLAGNNTYTGTTTVSNGTLLVNGDQSAATGTVTVNNSGTLGGNGIIGGAVQVDGNLAPGNSTGILTTGAVTLNSTSNFILEINGTTPGTGYDQLVVNGTVTLNLGNIVIASASGLNLNDKVFVVVNDDIDPVLGAFSQGATVTGGGYSFLINYVDNFGGTGVGNDISLTVTAIPEASTWIGAALALAAIGWTQLRKRSRAGSSAS